MITIFKDFSDVNAPHRAQVGKLLERIKTGAAKEKVDKIRSGFVAGLDVDEIKNSLPFIVWSADETTAIPKTKLDKVYYTHRADDSVVKHSGFICLDFDSVGDVHNHLSVLRGDPFCFACWISPKGNGIKMLIKVPRVKERHGEYFDAIKEYCEKMQYPQLDLSCRNIGRGCFESYDPDIFINKESKLWEKFKEPTPSLDRDNSLLQNIKWIKIPIQMIERATDGEKHMVLNKASFFMGGMVSAGWISEVEAIKLLKNAIRRKPNVKDINAAYATIEKAVEDGLKMPIKDLQKQLEDQRARLGKIFYKLGDVEGKLDEVYELGNPRGFLVGHPLLDELISFRAGATTYLISPPYLGKSTISFEWAVLLAEQYGLISAIFSPETGTAADIFGELCAIRARKDWTGDFKMSKEEFKEAKDWVGRYFIILDPEDNDFTPQDFYDYLDAIESYYDIKIFLAIIDPHNELKHDMRFYGGQRDRYFEDYLGHFRKNARASQRHNMLVTHTASLEKYTDKETGLRYQAEADIDDMAGGEAGSRKGEQMIILSKPRFFQQNDDGVRYEDLYGRDACSNLIKVSCKKSKPKGIGKTGNVEQFYDWKQHRYFELVSGKSVYANDAPTPEIIESRPMGWTNEVKVEEAPF